MEAGVNLGLTVVLSITVFAGLFAIVVGYGKKLTDERDTKTHTLRKC